MSWSGRRAQALRLLCLATYGSTCHLCGRRGATTADHVIPRSKGGTDALENLRPAHKSCNSSRGDMWLHEWYATRRYQATTSAPSREW
ncbi:HNH endonuclease [Nocardia altamirensis]|uniref:HNH endonuclease n=1 Tax=Nocardia altamirensis TaxID=472158 RepID=UPI000A011BE8|nr:HNH endonuclease signature motif containing protein [Nocardia altamirensis]